MTKQYIVVSGIPASGKTTLARQLEPMLEFPVIDKDDVLEELLTAEGARTTARRRDLSRQSDREFQRLALQAEHAILVSFWHVAGMRPDSGTPITWLRSSAYATVHVFCQCAPAMAVNRFLERKRHPGHGDPGRSRSTLLAEFEYLAGLGAPALANPLTVDTGVAVDVTVLATQIRLGLVAAQLRVAVADRR